MLPTDSRPTIPPLAGLCDFEAAQRPGLAVEECVAWHKRNHYVLKRLFELLTARITAEPQYELKTAFSHHAYLCAEHVTALRTRVSEMREPPLGLEEIPHPALQLLCDEVLCAPTTHLLVGVYEVLVPELIASFESYAATTNPLGVKGCGEAGCAGSLTSIMNAVVDALSPFGVKHIDMPATPQRVWATINRNRAAAE